MNQKSASISKFLIDSCLPLKGILACVCLCTLYAAIDSNLRPYLIKLIINQEPFTISAYAFLAGLYIISQILTSFVGAATDWCGTLFHTNFRRNIAHRYLDELSKYPYSFFQETQSGVITAKIADAFNTPVPLIFLGINKFLFFILTVFIALITLSFVSIVFAISCIIWIALFLSLSAYFYVIYDPINKEYAKCRPRIFGFYADYFSNILSVWNFANITYEKEKFSELIDDWFNKANNGGVFLSRFYFVHGFLVAIYMSFLVIYLGYLRSIGHITLGDYALVFMINFKITDLLYDISTASRDFVVNCGVIQNAIDLLEHKKQEQDAAGAPKLLIIKGEISFENVSYSYINSKKLFSNLSLRIKPSEKVGLVGYSGSGKTSFVNLILRLYELDSGKILIDGQDIARVTRESLRSSLAIIPQDPGLFNRSLFENIAYGNLEASKEEVIEASKAAKAHDFISRLKDGYDTLVGERGIKLSGGQRQRIAIARAILKKAPMLILDEATSQLDSLTENEIGDSLLPLMNKSTTIAVAHRLSTLIHMDRILVFDDGKIVEDGSHKELMKKNGLYKSMWDEQVGGFLPKKRCRKIEFLPRLCM
ncbi:MAG: ABC transporter ATP-binding protein [Rickettsiaceae bacterium]|nr:ABC transporter ATP-binding protein [Rickettsiaceae bacterium]